MLTVRIIDHNTHVEHVHEAIKVEYRPSPVPYNGPGDVPPPEPALGLHITLDKEERNATFYSLSAPEAKFYREAFVMNENGNTIARYIL